MPPNAQTFSPAPSFPSHVSCHCHSPPSPSSCPLPRCRTSGASPPSPASGTLCCSSSSCSTCRTWCVGVVWFSQFKYDGTTCEVPLHPWNKSHNSSACCGLSSQLQPTWTSSPSGKPSGHGSLWPRKQRKQASEVREEQWTHLRESHRSHLPLLQQSGSHCRRVPPQKTFSKSRKGGMCRKPKSSLVDGLGRFRPLCIHSLPKLFWHGTVWLLQAVHSYQFFVAAQPLHCKVNCFGMKICKGIFPIWNITTRGEFSARLPRGNLWD